MEEHGVYYVCKGMRNQLIEKPEFDAPVTTSRLWRNGRLGGPDLANQELKRGAHEIGASHPLYQETIKGGLTSYPGYSIPSPLIAMHKEVLGLASTLSGLKSRIPPSSTSPPCRCRLIGSTALFRAIKQ